MSRNSKLLPLAALLGVVVAGPALAEECGIGAYVESETDGRIVVAQSSSSTGPVSGAAEGVVEGAGAAGTGVVHGAGAVGSGVVKGTGEVVHGVSEGPVGAGKGVVKGTAEVGKGVGKGAVEVGKGVGKGVGCVVTLGKAC